MGDIIARLSPHRKAATIELLYGVTTNQPLGRSHDNLFRQPAGLAIAPHSPLNSTREVCMRHQYALAELGYRGTMTRFRIEIVLPCRIPLPSLSL